jgi:hypothetical protein
MRSIHQLEVAQKIDESDFRCVARKLLHEALFRKVLKRFGLILPKI